MFWPSGFSRVVNAGCGVDRTPPDPATDLGGNPERDELRQARLEELRREISAGLDACHRGEVVEGDEVFRQLWEHQVKLEGQL